MGFNSAFKGLRGQFFPTMWMGTETYWDIKR